MKVCNKCETAKAFSEFKSDPRNKDGLQGICKDCNKAWQRKRREERRNGIGLVKVTEKACNRCGQIKSVGDFYKDSGVADGHATMCKLCRDVSMRKYREEHRESYNQYMRDFRANNRDWAKNTDLWRTYGITLEQYNKMKEEQGGVCAICHKEAQGKRPLVVDHDHKTNKVRQLLCYGCNRALHAIETSDLHSKALDYIKKHAT